MLSLELPRLSINGWFHGPAANAPAPQPPLAPPEELKPHNDVVSGARRRAKPPAPLAPLTPLTPRCAGAAGAVGVGRLHVAARARAGAGADGARLGAVPARLPAARAARAAAGRAAAAG